MTTRIPLCLTVTGVLFAGMVVSASSQTESLTDEKFRQLHAELQPDNSQLWRTIPWKISVLDAQQAAARENKPIFIWAMDGHPLGCT